MCQQSATVPKVCRSPTRTCEYYSLLFGNNRPSAWFSPPANRRAITPVGISVPRNPNWKLYPPGTLLPNAYARGSPETTGLVAAAYSSGFTELGEGVRYSTGTYDRVGHSDGDFSIRMLLTNVIAGEHAGRLKVDIEIGRWKQYSGQGGFSFNPQHSGSFYSIGSIVVNTTSPLGSIVLSDHNKLAGPEPDTFIEFL